MNILVVEDDPRIADVLQRGLGDNGHQVAFSANGKEAAEIMLSGRFDAALLDILLPGMDGLSVLEHVRSKRCKTPIMVLTAVDEVPKLLQAFDLGADDYLVKPFMLEVLLARLGAISRRRQVVDSPVLTVGNVTLNRNRRLVTRDDKDIHLTRKQFEMLDLLMRRSGMVTTRDDLIEAAWGFLADVKDNTLDVYIHGLRAKLEVPERRNQTVIRTVHGTGYIFEAR